MAKCTKEVLARPKSSHGGSIRFNSKPRGNSAPGRAREGVEGLVLRRRAARQVDVAPAGLTGEWGQLRPVEGESLGRGGVGWGGGPAPRLAFVSEPWLTHGQASTKKNTWQQHSYLRAIPGEACLGIFPSLLLTVKSANFKLDPPPKEL